MATKSASVRAAMAGARSPSSPALTMTGVGSSVAASCWASAHGSPAGAALPQVAVDIGDAHASGTHALAAYMVVRGEQVLEQAELLRIGGHEATMAALRGMHVVAA